MDFEPTVICEIINFVLFSSRKNDTDAFKIFLITLKKYFNIFKLQKKHQKFILNQIIFL